MSNMKSQCDGDQELFVAALVLTYNQEHYIGACLKSILAIDFFNLHIWVLDDGSTDNTVSVIERLASETGRITLLTQPNSGGRTAANTQRLIEATHSRYVLFMSGDDMLGPAFPISRTIELLDADKQLGLVIPRLMFLTQEPSRDVPSIYRPALLSALRSGNPERVLVDHLYRSVSRIFLQGVVARRSLIEEVGGFDTSLLADDYAFVLKLFQHLTASGRRFHFDEESLWLYRLHENNIHLSALRQFRLILQVVAQFVPGDFRRNFEWDLISFDSVDDLNLARCEAKSLLGHEHAQIVMLKIERATLKALRTRGNKQLLTTLIIDRQLEPRSRLYAIKVLLGLMLRRYKRINKRS